MSWSVRVLVGLQRDGLFTAESAHEDAGDLARRGEARLTVQIGHDGAGGAHRTVDEQNWILGPQVAQPVVVHHFDDLHVLRPRDRLAELVVIHENDLGGAGPHDVPAGEDAQEPPIVVGDHEDRRVQRCGLAKDTLHGRVRSKPDVVL